MIWLVGANGLLGRELSGLFFRTGLPFVGTGRELSVTDLPALEAFAQENPVGWIVNGAAYTAVDRAEEEPTLCRAINALGPQNLGKVAERIGARVLHVSTDYVFDGGANQPYHEDCQVNPLNVYGRTKAEGEVLLQEANAGSIVLRTAWLYGIHGPNFIATMLRLMKEKDSLGVVADQYGTPTWAADLASVIVSIVTTPPAQGGLYHASGEGKASWHEFAKAIGEEARSAGLLDSHKPVEIRQLSTAEYPTKAKRPPWTVLSKDKLYEELGLSFPPWRESLHAYFQRLTNKTEGQNPA